MPSGIKVSIGSLMLFIILVALQLVLFQGVWEILVSSPITIMVLTLNLGMFFVLVRPPALEPRIIGMLLGGLVACVTLMIMMLISSELQRTRWTTLGRRRRVVPRPTGPIGKLVDDELFRWLASLPDQQSPTATILGFVILNINVIEYVLLDLIGVVLIWAGGWIESRLRRRCVRARAPGPSAFPPLDDRAATPL
jgi:hypothetical protein